MHFIFSGHVSAFVFIARAEAAPRAAGPTALESLQHVFRAQGVEYATQDLVRLTWDPDATADIIREAVFDKATGAMLSLGSVDKATGAVVERLERPCPR